MKVTHATAFQRPFLVYTASEIEETIQVLERLLVELGYGEATISLSAEAAQFQCSTGSLGAAFSEVEQHGLFSIHAAWAGQNLKPVSFSVNWLSLHMSLNVADPRTFDRLVEVARSHFPRRRLSQLQPGSNGEVDVGLQHDVDRIVEERMLLDDIRRRWEVVELRSEVSRHARIFEDQASAHAVAAYLWLGMSFLFVVVTLAVGLELYHWNTGQVPPEGARVLLNFLFLSLPVGALSTSLSQYSRERHNYVVGTHRAQAIDSYVAFSNLPDSTRGTKTALLAQAIALIFTPQDSAFGRFRAAPTSPSLQRITADLSALAKLEH